ncbi:AzlD domain-containing protein [Marivibrio halodurans]|uniref:AzlD domain-containing protein n=1 Tax=Marivibrio halodurans TaxID=2039722 RepID=A0A8J7SM73_9PROT|nr:AzlD domain-containing protein [Marivibrio halodurans]MBP5857223.1 AzlD domain-containing protein [Marivibrio halodurans]
MSGGEFQVWGIILLIAGVTLASRLCGPFIMRAVPITGWVERFLDGVAVSVIAALVAAGLAQRGPREVAAVAVSAVVMLVTRSPVAAMVAGLAVAAGWTGMLG